MNIYKIILIFFYRVGFKKSSLQLAHYWYESRNYRKHLAGSSFSLGWSDFPRCYECEWPVIPGYPHHDCDEKIAAMLATEEEDWQRYCAEEAARWAQAQIEEDARLEEEERAARAGYEAEIAVEDEDGVCTKGGPDCPGCACCDPSWDSYHRSEDEWERLDAEDDRDDAQDNLHEHYADECSRDHHQHCIGGPYSGHWADYNWEDVEPCPANGRMCAGCSACESPEGRGEYLAWQDMQSWSDDDPDDYPAGPSSQHSEACG